MPARMYYDNDAPAEALQGQTVAVAKIEVR